MLEAIKQANSSKIIYTKRNVVASRKRRQEKEKLVKTAAITTQRLREQTPIEVFCTCPL
jgi:hypothetical protein